ncbi:MAG: S-methyl-5'-thioadenosine phosphorylase [archaeon]
MVKIGIIGGSGMDNPNLLENYERVDVMTPFGQPSSSVTTGTLNGVEVAVIARHGRKHQIMPTNVNNRANIWALKELGCTHILATTAVGSLKEEVRPGELVILDQLIDKTHFRKKTFYTSNQVCHISLADPFCEKMRKLMIQTAQELALPHHAQGTVVTIEGPRFSTRAESKMFQMYGADVINMSTAPEATLAREAGLCYASIAMSTDYDCWKMTEEPVTWEEICKVMKLNADNVTNLIKAVVPKIQHNQCECMDAIKTALI